MSRLIPIALALLLAGSPGCRKRSLESSSSAARASSSAAAQSPPVAPASAAEPSRLPEDPVAGERSVAQWREHLAEEERERQLNYDRRRLKEHRAVLSFLTTTRAGYDRAQNKAAILKGESDLGRALVGVRQRIQKIDPWGVNSKLLGDYSALLELLSKPYPEARLAALSGDTVRLAALGAEFDARMKKITDWLAQAAETEDEG